MRRTTTGGARLYLCAAVLATSFALSYAGYSAATQFGDGDNCGPGTDGTNGADVYFMGAGNDCAHMLGGGDFLDGQGGADKPLDGDDGPDWVIGGGGNDEIRGGHGGDLTDGQDGGDWLVDRNGIDTLRGGENGDFVDARDGAGGDDVSGGGAEDWCSWDFGDPESGCENFYN